MIGKFIYSFVHPNDHTKFKILFNMNNNEDLDLNNSTSKFNNSYNNKPFNCQFLIKSSNTELLQSKFFISFVSNYIIFLLIFLNRFEIAQQI
jgi:hypothetical protein